MNNLNFKLRHIKIEFEEWNIKIPYYFIKGQKKGLNLFISGGMHGNEINGIAAVRTFLEKASEEDFVSELHGNIYVLPIINLSGFEKGKRYCQEDKKDPNRAFTSKTAATFSEALASTLTQKIFSKCDLGIDIHDAGGNSLLMPHVRVHQNDSDGASKKLGRAFGTKILVKRKANAHTMAEFLRTHHSVDVITVEIGGAQVTDEDSIKTCYQGIINILAHTKMLPNREKVLPKKQFLLTKRIGVKTLGSGELHIYPKLGDRVEVGDEIGWIYFPQLQKKEILKAPTSGFIFAKWFRNHIPKNYVMYGVLEDGENRAQNSAAQEELEEIPEFVVKKHNFSAE